jgi:hypothetical protein
MQGSSEDVQVREVTRGAEESIKSVWFFMLMYPEWAQRLSTQESVRHILEFAERVINGLNMPSSHLRTTDPEELIFYWRKCFNDHFDDVPPRVQPDPTKLALEIVRNIAGGVYSMHQQSRRYLAYLNTGFPAGMPTFPEYTGGTSSKDFHMPWGLRATSCDPATHRLFASTQGKLPQRRQGLRASPTTLSDAQHPEAFA